MAESQLVKSKQSNSLLNAWLDHSEVLSKYSKIRAHLSQPIRSKTNHDLPDVFSHAHAFGDLRC